jgi:hypothetical protein
MRRFLLLWLATIAVFLAMPATKAYAVACEARDSGRKFEDTDCDGVKDAGEEYYGLAAAAPAADSIGTSELDENGDTASAGFIVTVNDGDTAALEYKSLGAGLVDGADSITVDHDAATNFVANEHIDHTSVQIATGLFLSGGGTIASTRTLVPDFGQTLAGNPAANAEECFFSTDGTSGGGFVCEGSTANTNEQLYLFPVSDGADTTNYIALADSSGNALRIQQGAKQTGGNFTATDDAARIYYTARKQTTTNSQSELFLDGSATRMTIPSDTSWHYSCHVVGRRTDADNETAVYDLVGGIDNNAGTTALVGDLWQDILAEDTTAWSVTVSADNTNDALLVQVTGENSKTINWVAGCDLVQSTG